MTLEFMAWNGYHGPGTGPYTYDSFSSWEILSSSIVMHNFQMKKLKYRDDTNLAEDYMANEWGGRDSGQSPMVLTELVSQVKILVNRS